MYLEVNLKAMSLPNEIVLRPRFKFEVNSPNTILLEQFENSKQKQKEIIITRLDDHVFLKFPKREQHFWSPQLHLEIIEKDESHTIIHGLFGPNPTVWTMFMFLHFVVAGFFIAFGIWTYSNWSLDNDYAIQLSVVLFMVVLWFILYFAGRIGRAKGKPEMRRLYHFMKTTVEEF